METAKTKLAFSRILLREILGPACDLEFNAAGNLVSWLAPEAA
jgi:hypothetical protein